MSRSGYRDDLEPWEHIKWRGQVASAIRGRRGQKLLADLKAALEAMPEDKRRLVDGTLENQQGEVCALGAVARYRGIVVAVESWDHEGLGDAFGIAHQLAQEVMFVNDEYYHRSTPEQRWQTVYEWVCRELRQP